MRVRPVVLMAESRVVVSGVDALRMVVPLMVGPGVIVEAWVAEPRVVVPGIAVHWMFGPNVVGSAMVVPLVVLPGVIDPGWLSIG